MKSLSFEIQQNLITQILNKAQDIDVAILSYIQGEKDFFIDALMLYQNNNGGFGHNLYIDNYNPNSTSFTTLYALKLLYKFDVSSKLRDILVNKAFTYLYHKAYLEDDYYTIAEPDNNKYAHSQEFEYPAPKNIALTLGVIGVTLLLLDSNKPYYKLALEKYNKIKDNIKLEDINSDNFIDLAILIAGLNKAKITHDLKIDPKLLNINNILEINDYVDINPDLVKEALDTLLQNINSNGLWDYELNWHNSYPEEDVATIKWTFRMAVINFYYLKKYNLVDYN